MTLTTAEELAEALDEVHAATTPEERKRALARYVAAERAHFAKLGIDVQGGGSLTRLLPIVLIVVLIITAGIGISNASKTADLAESNRDAQFQTCERNNDSRLAAVKNFERDIAVFQSDVAFGQVILEIPQIEGTPLGDRVHDFIIAHRQAIRAKRHTIEAYIDAQAPVAVEPGSVVADCTRAVDAPK